MLNIEKTKIMASGPITSWEIDGETVETVADFILGGLQCDYCFMRREGVLNAMTALFPRS